MMVENVGHKQHGLTTALSDKSTLSEADSVCDNNRFDFGDISF